MRMYLYDVTNRLLHNRHCPLIDVNEEVIEYATLKLPLRHNLKPCSLCLEHEYKKAKISRNKSIIQELNKKYIFTAKSKVFHKPNCRFLYTANSLFGSDSYSECIVSGLTPCKYCKPEESDVGLDCRNGDIFLANLNHKEKNNIQSGIRPVLVVSNDKANRFSPIITIVPITSRLKRKNFPTHVFLKKYCGLQKDSIALVEQITILEKTKLIHKIGSIKNTDYERKVRDAILVQLSMNQ